MSVLGIDVGTAGCKAAAFSTDGQCLAAAHREYSPESPQAGWAQLNSAAVFGLVKAAVAEVAAATSADPITAVGISSMGEAATPVSRDREVLGPAILMSDVRGADYVRAFSERISQEEFYAINANILAPSYTMPKLCWLRDHEPELYGRADRFLLWADLVAFLLGGSAVTNYTHASRTLLFDLRAEDWSDRLISLSGLHREKLAPCVASGTLAGCVSRGVAEELGLSGEVAIVVGGHDQCCNALGAGLVRSGRAVCGIGTYECIAPVYARVPEAGFMLAHGFNVEHHVLDGLYLSFLYNQSGSVIRWFRDTFAADLRDEAADGEGVYDRLAAEMPEAPTSLLALPHFEVTGPPHFTSDSAGVILGLRTTTTRGEVLKCLMESITFYLVESVEALAEMDIDVSEFIATGGGARSDAWLQIKADIFGVPFVRPRVTEGSTLGAAILAGLATGVFASPAEAAERFVRRERVFEPDLARHGIYQERLARYRQLYPLLREFLTAAR